jgi:hypothetical protein
MNNADIAIGFSLNEKQMLRLVEWGSSHSCTITESGAIGGAYAFSFAPTNLGVVQTVQCACGANLDVTEYEHW